MRVFAQCVGEMTRAADQTRSSAGRAFRAADRMQRLRDRRRRHCNIVRIEYPAALPLALADAGLLAAWDSEDPTAVGKAIEVMLIDMCKKAGYEVTPSDDDLA